jgi:hypothetical protein
METKLLCYAILFLLSLTGCRQQRNLSAVHKTGGLYHTGGCTEPNELIKIWSMIDKKSIRRIILLRGPDVFIDNEPIEIPQECLEGYIELLDNAICQFKIEDTMDMGQTHQIKIITDKRTYLLPSEWMITGDRTDSKTYRGLQNYLFGCDVWDPRYDTTGWTKLHSPRKIWSTLKTENICRIIFCYAMGYNKADEWVVSFEVPQECLQDTIEFLDEAMREQKKIYSIPDAWEGFSGMKIITDRGKYLIPAGWSHSKWPRDDAIYGADWASRRLREYLRNCGWSDPNN